MSVQKILLVLTLAVLAATPATAALAAEAQPLPRLSAVADPRAGGHVVDSRGRQVLLRGVSVTSLAAIWKASAMRSTLPFGEADAARVQGMGFNVVRLAVSWSRIEPEPGRYDDRYLDVVGRRVDDLARRGIYTIIDLHQDAWGATLVAAAGQVCAVGTEPALGWSGAPGWATLEDGATRCAGAAREFNPAVRTAWTSFFANRPAADGVGVQTRYLTMLRHVSHRFAHSTALAAIDVMNEPGAMTPEQTAALSPFYARAIAAIRAGERDGRGVRHMIAVEPSVTWGLTWAGVPLDLRDTRGLVYSPHVYGGGTDGMPVPEPLDNARREAAAIGGAPIVVGAWGADPAQAGKGDDGYFPRQQALQDRYGLSAVFWTWKQSCGDPASILRIRANGDTWRPWAVHRMDCRGGRNRDLGPNAALVGDLARGYLRAAPGRRLSTTWRHRVLRARGVAGRRSAPVEAFYPGARRPQVAVRGARRASIVRAGDTGWIVTARPRGGAWRLQAYAAQRRR